MESLECIRDVVKDDDVDDDEDDLDFVSSIAGPRKEVAVRQPNMLTNCWSK
jgi:hypothetical protein